MVFRVWAMLWCVSMAGRRCYAPVHRQSAWARCCGDDAAGWRRCHQLFDGLLASYSGCCPGRGITQRWLVDAFYSSSLLAALSAQVHGWTPLGIACNRGKLEVAVALIRRGDGVNMLLVCATLCAHLFHSVLFFVSTVSCCMTTVCCAVTLSLMHSLMVAAPCGLLVKLDTLPL